MRENQFKQIYNNAYKKSVENNNRAHQHRNKHKLGKPLEVGRKVLMENHQIELGTSKKLHELRSGPYSVAKKLTNVYYEGTLDSNPVTRKVAYRNHLVEYYPATETIPELTLEYGIDKNNCDTFYNNLMTSQMNKLNSPLTKFSFQSPTNTEYFPVEKFIRRDSPVQNFDPDRTPTNFDSGFNEASSGGRDNPPPVQTHLPSGSQTRSSTPCPQHNSRMRLDPNLSPLRPNRSEQGPSNLQYSENNNNR